MIRIAHRGNVDGPSHQENRPSYLREAIDRGYDIELDLWKVNNILWLGHDAPQYPIPEDFLIEVGHAAWIHCKNLEALDYLVNHLPQLNFFWHQEDSYTLTSQGYIWAYPGMPVTSKSIIVDLDNSGSHDVLGVCSDYPDNIQLLDNED